MTEKIGIIGYGNMGSAIAQQLKEKFKIFVFDKDKEKTKDLLGIVAADSVKDLLNKVNIVILAVKPQDFDVLLDEIKIYAKGKVVISIAAGISTIFIEKHLGGVRVVRVMPNLPAKIGKGMICLCKGESATDKDLNFSKELFKNLGRTLVLDENLMDAACAISGSGPGYLYDWAEGKNIEEIKKYAQDVFIPALLDSAKSIGFSPEEARVLAESTGEGSIEFLEKTNISAQEAKKLVASKSGTTEAGLEIIHKGGSLKEAVIAAIKRAKELSKKE
jgi:pyrroline-5-carboxylate reductase